MELISFRERIYGKFDQRLFVFEPSWDSFRPISGIGWDGAKLVPIDAEYKQDVFSSLYGYNSLETKALCKTLTQETELDDAKCILDPVYVWRWYGEKNVKWWRDRPCVFLSPCVSKDSLSWKMYLSYLDTRAKTLRRPYHGRATRRLLPK
jgi:hypothetical protein